MPNSVSVDLGRVPKNRGTYVSGTHYYKDNIVQYQGSSFIANPTSANKDGNDGTAQAPEWYLTRTPFETDPNTPRLGWEVFATGKHNFSTGENIDDVGITDAVTKESSDLVTSGAVEAVTYITRDLLASAEVLDSTYIAHESSIKGNLTTNDGYTVYKIKNNGYKTISGKASGTAILGCPVVVFYSGEPSHSTFISSIDVGPVYANPMRVFNDVTVPDDCEYIAIERFKYYETECKTSLEVNKKAEELQQEVDEVTSLAEGLKETVGDNKCLKVSVHTEGGVITASSGEITVPENSTAFGVSDYIPVTPGSTITIVKGIRQPGNTSYAYCAFYSDTTGSEQSHKSSMVNTEAGVEITDTAIKVPAGANYMVLYLNSRVIEATILYGTSVLDSIEDLNQRETASEALARKLVNHAEACPLTVADFTLNNQIYKNNDAVTEYRADVKSTRLIPVTEGQKIYWHNWKHYTPGPTETQPLVAVAAVYCYNSEGKPFNNQTDAARFNYGNLDTADYGAGEYSFTVPAGCTQVGFSNNLAGSYPVQTDANIDIQECYSLTETSKEMIGDNTANSSGGDSSKYYLKGGSNISYSPSKSLGIIAAGQSNINGRDPYDDYPYKAQSTNPNDKVHIKKSDTYNQPVSFGEFEDFEITDGGNPPGYDWSFDAIVYNLLTDENYGSQSNIYVMKTSMGGTSIDKDGTGGGTNPSTGQPYDCHWTADYEFLTSESKSLLRTFEKTIRNGLSENLPGTQTKGEDEFEIKAMLWSQGSGDSHTEEVANRYYDNLKNTFAYIRGVVGNPRLHIFCHNVSLKPRIGQSGYGFLTTINEAYARLASEDPYLHVVDMSEAELRADEGVHINSAWSTYLGQKIYNLMIDTGIVSGTKITPEPTPPSNS